MLRTCEAFLPIMLVLALAGCHATKAGPPTGWSIRPEQPSILYHYCSVNVPFFVVTVNSDFISHASTSCGAVKWSVTNNGCAILEELGSQQFESASGRYACKILPKKSGPIIFTAEGDGARSTVTIACVDDPAPAQKIVLPYIASLVDLDVASSSIITCKEDLKKLWNQRLRFIRFGGEPATPSVPEFDFTNKYLLLLITAVEPWQQEPIITRVEDGRPATISVVIPGNLHSAQLFPAIAPDRYFYLFEIPRIDSPAFLYFEQTGWRAPVFQQTKQP